MIRCVRTELFVIDVCIPNATRRCRAGNGTQGRRELNVHAGQVARDGCCSNGGIGWDLKKSAVCVQVCAVKSVSERFSTDWRAGLVGR